MLDMERDQQITDIIHVTIPYSGIEHAVISTPIYNRLHRVLQSSLVFLTYPSNKVKRFEHSIGVMHLAGNMFFNSICNASTEVINDFMDKISAELTVWRKKLDFTKYSFVSKELRNQCCDKDILTAPVPDSKFYHKYQPQNIREKHLFAYFVAFQAIRLAGALHDAGHLPYSHILEHALKRMYNETKNEETPSEGQKDFLEIMKRFAEGEDEIHEEIGKLLVQNIKTSIIENITDKSDPNIYFFLAAFDFAEQIICSNFSDNTIFADLHLITASVLDADRLDYCSRDSYCAGIDNSIYTYNKLLNNYRMNKIKEDDVSRFYFCPSTKSVSNIEELLRKRKCIFSEINYHHRVHKHEILLEEVISKLGVDELKQEKEKKEDINSQQNLPYTLPLKVSGIWKLISKLDARGNWPEYQIIQLDDSWLDTLLKHNFFEIYKENYLSLRKHGNDILWNRFDELISTTNRYRSFLKRANDFREFDKLFFNQLKVRRGEINKSLSEQLPNLDSYKEFYEKHHSFVFNYCVDKIIMTDSHKERFFNDFESEIIERSQDSKLNINDCLLRSCMFSFGYKTAKTPLFLSDNFNHTIRIEQISNQLEIFQQERAVSPIFHLYYLPTYNIRYNSYDTVDSECFKNVLATAAVETIVKFGHGVS